MAKHNPRSRGFYVKEEYDEVNEILDSLPSGQMSNYLSEAVLFYHRTQTDTWLFDKIKEVMSEEEVVQRLEEIANIPIHSIGALPQAPSSAQQNPVVSQTQEEPVPPSATVPQVAQEQEQSIKQEESIQPLEEPTQPEQSVEEQPVQQEPVQQQPVQQQPVQEEPVQQQQPVQEKPVQQPAPTTPNSLPVSTRKPAKKKGSTFGFSLNDQE